MDINPLGLLTPSQQTADSAGKLSDNFDDFLLLLTTQLQHQNPLEPMDPNEFTSQLVQFSSVEQLIAQNARLDSLLNLQRSSQVADAVSFVGKTVEVIGDTVALAGGKAQVSYTLSKPASAVNVVIRNSAGEVVRTLSGDNTVGDHAVAWDGLSDQGVPQPEGAYTFEVTAVDEEGASTRLNTTVAGVVDGVSNDGGNLVLGIGGVNYSLSDVVSVKSTPLSQEENPEA